MQKTQQSDLGVRVLGFFVHIKYAMNTTHRLHENRSEEHTSELQSLTNLVCRLLLEKKKNKKQQKNNNITIMSDPNPVSNDKYDNVTRHW